MHDYETIRYEVDGVRATVTLNRPDRLNAITNQMMTELYDCLNVVARDDSVRVVLFTGEGKGFCPGVDLKASTSGVAQEPFSRECFFITALLHEMPKVTVAAINGACAGAGFGWAAACDLRYATASAMFSSAFLGVAIAGDMAGPWLLPRILGAQKARELWLLPDKFDGAEAERIGLVARTFPDETFRDEVESIVDRLAKSAPLALTEIKRNFVNAENMPLRDYIHIETERHSRTGASEDTREAFLAFVEKREAKFQGR